MQLLVFLTSLYIGVYASIRPHEDRNRTQLEVFNEVMIMVSNYHMLLFSKFNINDEFLWQMGYSYIFFVGVTISVNCYYITTKTLAYIERRRRISAS